MNTGMSKPLHVIFRADASPGMGGGHVMRCLTLADALVAAGCRATFVTRPETSAIVPQLYKRGHVAMTLEGAEHQIREEALRNGLAGDWLVIDHYALDAADETAWRAAAPRILILDDLADRAHDCDLLVDSSFGRVKSDYFGLVAPPVRILAGPAYALVRPGFAQRRPAALDRRLTATSTPPRLFVSLGLTDVGGATAHVIDQILAAKVAADIDCLVPAWAPSFVHLQALASRHPNLRIHHDIADPSELMAQATLAIGGGGQTSFERCALGLPSLVLILADNQERAAHVLRDSGAACLVKADDLARELQRLLGSPAILQAMSSKAAALVDGKGTQRICDLLLTPRVDFRDAESRDSALVLAWRNDPETRRQSRETASITPAAHDAWFAARLADPDTLFLIVETGAKPVGIVRFERNDARTARVSANLAPEARGRGLAAPMLAGALMTARARGFCRRVEVEVRAGNTPSLKLVGSCNFRHSETRDGWHGFELDLDPPPALARGKMHHAHG